MTDTAKTSINSSMRLLNKSILITGGGTGIGRACAELFAAQGAKVAITGRRSEPLEETASAIQSSLPDARVLALAGDASLAEDVERIVRKMTDEFGRIDGLVNNAGVFSASPVDAVDEAEFERIFSINVKGPFLFTRAIAPLMKVQGGGSILNISSTLGSKPAAMTSVYSASKGALNIFTRAWALEFAPHQIRVNGIEPAVVDTPIHEPGEGEAGSREERMEQYKNMHPLGRVGRPEEIAVAAVYFLSDESLWTTGTILNVDGGVNAGSAM